MFMNRVEPFRKEEKKGRSRSMSFNSSVFVTGAFPKKAEVLPSIINVLLLLKTIPSTIILEDASKKLMQFDRFRNALKHDGKEWQFLDAEVDFSNQIQTVTVSSEKGVMEETDRIAQNDLGKYDGIRPLWIFHRITNQGIGLSGLLIRIHHCIGDGISIVNALSEILTDGSGVTLSVVPISGKVDVSGSKKKPRSSPSFYQKLTSFFQIISLPSSKYDTRTLFSPKNNRNMIMTRKRRTIIFPAVRLEFIKVIKNKANVTVNDVLLSVLTGAIRKYCERRGDTAMQSKVLQNRCLMPVLVPRPNDPLADPSNALRNNWVLVSVPIPLTSSSAKDRLYKCNIATSEIKRSPTVGIQMKIQQILPNILPLFMQQKIAYDIFSRHTMSFSNVTGPPVLSFLGGEQVEGIQVLFPTLLPQGIVVSYAGGLYLNLNMDDDDLPGAADELPRFYIEELKELAMDISVGTEFMLTEKSPEGYFSVSSHV